MNGNRVTAERWRRLLRGLGHGVEIIGPEDSTDAELLVALHARKSHGALETFHRRFPARPIIVAISGTDVSLDLAEGGRKRALVEESFAVATRLVALHPLVENEIPSEHRKKLRVILQSARALESPPPKTRRTMNMVVVGHLRPVKDPFLPARALRALPARSRVRIHHYGRALDPTMLAEARAAMAADPRYRWKGEKPRGEVRQAIARAHALIHPSVAEGGANTVGEALVLGTAVLATAIPGNLGILGPDHPGVFPVGDAEALTALLVRFESEPEFRARLEERCAFLAERHREEREAETWTELLAEVAG